MPVGAGASVRREWMSSTASVSSIYGNGNGYICLWKQLHTSLYLLSQIHTSRTKASFLPWERSSSDTSSELSEWERKSLDLCLGSGIGDPTTSSVSSCKQRGTKGLSRQDAKVNTITPQLQPTSASHICPASRKTMLITHHMLTLTQVTNQLHHYTRLVLI